VLFDTSLKKVCGEDMEPCKSAVGPSGMMTIMSSQQSASHWDGDLVGLLDQLGEEEDSFERFKVMVASRLGVEEDQFYLTVGVGGKIVESLEHVRHVLRNQGRIVIQQRLKGGKGGFGSMLRAIGAQIEKTTNRDACRDLSGRRLRDINEEQRLKRWFERQKEREEERAAAKKKKLEKLKQLAEGPPLPKIDDQEYLKQREEIAESIYDAVDQGFEASKTEFVTPSTSKGDDVTVTDSSDAPEPTSGIVDAKETTSKPGPSYSVATTSASTSVVKKKAFKKTMLDEDFSSSSDDESESEDVPPPKKAKTEF